MEAELVGAEVSGEGGVIVERALEFGEVALEVDSFFEVAHEAGCEADQADAVGQAAVGDDVMFGQGCGLIGFINAELDFVIALCSLLHFGNIGR